MICLRPLMVCPALMIAVAAVAAETGTEARGRVQQQFHVSPSGSDDHPGTEAKPFATIERARSAVRRINRQMSGDIVVVLRGGIYRPAETLAFDAEDSGTNGHYVVYRNSTGEVPLVSGGRPVTGWEPDAGGRWKARTDVKNFRQLYVNGERMTRARGPAPAGIKLFGTDGYRTTQAAMTGWRNPSDLELCFYVYWGQRKAWTHTRCKVRSIHREGDEAVIEMLQPHFTMARNKQGVIVELPTYMENAMELLDEPGEWYLDRPAGVVYYMPRLDQDMRKAEVIAPAVEKLVELRGTLDQPVRNIRFEGITFAEAGWLRTSEIGLVDVQANFINDFEKQVTSIKPFVTSLHNEQIKAPSNVVCRAVRAIHFERCTFTRLGSGGLDLEFGAQDNIVRGCRFFDISGTAIQLGDVLKDDHHPDDPRMIVRGNVISNNVIHDVGIEYQGSVGIFAGYVCDTVIDHNVICYLPYTGISVGWGWGEEDVGGGEYPQPFNYDTPTPAKNNRIEYNHIHHTSMTLTDGGGIYTLSNMPGSIIRGNHIHDSLGMPGGIYLDEGSGFIEVTGNLVHDVPKPMNYNNRAQNRIATCRVHDNFFDVRPTTTTAPREISEIIAGAGLAETYGDLLPGSPKAFR